jgi:hypothetical protein
MSGIWDDDRCNFLKENYNGNNVKELAEKLGVSPHTKVYPILSKLGLTSKFKCTDENEYTNEVEGEIWKAIPDIIPEQYEVSNLGRIRNTKFRRILKATLNDHGYFSLEINAKQMRVHKLIAHAFCNKPDSELTLVVNHIDGIKTNNKAENLEYITHSDNIYHAIKLGLKPIGVAGDKLTDDLIHSICKMIKDNKTYSSIIKELNLKDHWRSSFYKFKNCTYRPDITESYFKK